MCLIAPPPPPPHLMPGYKAMSEVTFRIVWCFVSPHFSLQTVSLDADIPLAQVLHFASHLVYWGKAIAIYPLSESNVYFASPIAETRL